MTPAISFLSTTAVLGSTLVLAACGGSDNAGLFASGTPSTTTMSGSSINSTNMRDVAANALLTSGGLSQQPGSDTSPAINTAGPGTAIASVNQVFTAQNAQSVSNFPTITINCSQGGTTTIRLDAATTQRLSSGDSLSIAASSCVQGTKRADGTIDIHVTSLTGTPSSTSVWSGAFGFTFTNFTFDSGNEVDSANGDVSLSFNQTAPGTGTFGLTGNSLKVSNTKNGSTTERTLSNFSTTGSVNSNVFTYRTNFTLSANVPSLGTGPFTVNTTRDFVQQRGSAPSQGVLVVRASDNTSLTLTTVDTTNVNIAADVTGDGVVDDTVATTWSELESFLRANL